MGRATDRVVSALATRLASSTDRAIRTVVMHRGPAIAASGDALRAASPGADPGELVAAAVKRRSWHLAGTGAASALPAVLPGPGTAAEVGAALGDVTLLTGAQVELVLLAAHLFGRPLSDHDARLLDVLLVLGIDVGAVKLKRGGVVQAMGASYRPEELGGAREDALAGRVSGRLAVQVTGRLARRRAHVILGRAIPVLGLGLAAGYNLLSTRRLGDTAVRYFRHIA
jgi:uncharacterized protein (DUF697 family)